MGGISSASQALGFSGIGPEAETSELVTLTYPAYRMSSFSENLHPYKEPDLGFLRADLRDQDDVCSFS